MNFDNLIFLNHLKSQESHDHNLLSRKEILIQCDAFCEKEVYSLFSSSWHFVIYSYDISQKVITLQMKRDFTNDLKRLINKSTLELL